MSSAYNTASSSSSTASQFDIGSIIPGGNTRIVQLLGAGGFGRVFKAKNKFHILSAVKVNRNVTQRQQKENLHEASVLKAIFTSGKTEYLVKSNRQFAHGTEFVFQMEILDISLLDFLMRRKGMGPLEIPTIVSLFTQVLKATVDLYEVGYVHGDIKLENILICKEAYKGMRIKLADYGLSTHKEHIGTFCGGTLMNIKLQDIRARATRTKWNWAQHVSHMSPERWTRRLVEWRPMQFTRQMGRPKRRWRDQFKEQLGEVWMQTARSEPRTWKKALTIR